jgi:YfiH family protein
MSWKPDAKDYSAMYPFRLSFANNCTRFPFIFDGKPVVSVGNPSGETTADSNAAPSCLISCRAAGDMVFRSGERNVKRERFFRSLSIPLERVYSLVQIHSHDVFTLGTPKSDNSPETPAERTAASLPSPFAFEREGDGMVSFSFVPIPAVTVADCLSVFLLDTEKGYLSVLHSGWKGTGIVLRALEIMQKAGSRPEAIAAVLGPCIQGCCYRVDEERAKMFEGEFGSAFNPLIRKQTGGSGYPLGPVSRRDSSGFYLSLQAANARLLTAAGVRHIAYCTDCTFTDLRLGSFRREGQSYTRMIAMAGFGL